MNLKKDPSRKHYFFSKTCVVHVFVKAFFRDLEIFSNPLSRTLTIFRNDLENEKLIFSGKVTLCSTFCTRKFFTRDLESFSKGHSEFVSKCSSRIPIISWNKENLRTFLWWPRKKNWFSSKKWYFAQLFVAQSFLREIWNYFPIGL